MRKLTATAMMALLALGLLVIPAGAQWWENEKVVERLGLTEEQTTQLQVQGTQFREGIKELHEKNKAVGQELKELWKADELDEAGILAKVVEQAEIRQAIALNSATHRIAVCKILTPEQRAQVQKFSKRMRQRRGGGEQGGPGMKGRGMRGEGMRGEGMRGEGMRGRGRQQGPPPEDDDFGQAWWK